MVRDRADLELDRPPGSIRPLAIALIAMAAVALIYVAHLVDRHTIQVVVSQRLLPRWDLATHLTYGWDDYHLFVTGQIHRLLWDLWLQGYWPPVLSMYQLPFYVALGGGLAAGLRSALAAFVLVGLLGCAVMWRQWKDAAALPSAVFVALLISSPYLLAYGSVTMTEIVGAAAQLVVLLAYAGYREHPSPSTARGFALSLTLLFFTKYNYFFLLVVPLVIYEWLERPSHVAGATRREELRQWARAALRSPTVWVLTIYLVGLLIVMRTGGFDFYIAGKRISVHTVGNSGHVVLYALLARLWYLHRQRRIDWRRLISADFRVRPLLIWFAIPVTIWLATPYPNHIRDFFNLVVNRPLGESTVGGGTAVYVDALRYEYFYSQSMLFIVLVTFVVAALQYRRQPPVIRWLVIAVPLQLTAIVLHQTRFPRFLLLTVVLLCLIAASEVGRCFARSSRGRLAGTLAAPFVLAIGVLAARYVVTQERFHSIAFENYTDNAALRAALDSIRAELTADDRLAFVGQSNELSPALLRWELGRPSRLACAPFEIGGARGVDLSLATKVLLIAPMATGTPVLDMTSYYVAQRQEVLAEMARGDLTLQREIPVPDRHLALQIYKRTSIINESGPCR